MRVVTLKETTMFAGAIGLWASGCLLGAALMLRGGEGYAPQPVAELSPGLVWMPRPESLFWRPSRIVIAPSDEPSWRTIVAHDLEGYVLAEGVPPPIPVADEVAERPQHVVTAVTEERAPQVGVSTVTEGEISQLDARPLIWVTREDAAGRKYRCLVPVQPWQARALASADWQLRLAGVSPASPRSESAGPERWLDPRFCETSSGQLATPPAAGAAGKHEKLARLNMSTGEPDLRSTTHSLMWPARAGVTPPAVDGAPPLDWIQLRSAINSSPPAQIGSQGTAAPIPRERVMQSL